MPVENEKGIGTIAAAGGKTPWTVLAVCEEEKSRPSAVKFCDELVKRFWANFDFEVAWESLQEIENSPFEAKRIAKAAAAQIIIFAFSSPTELPAGVKSWIECWLTARGDREGMLVVLNDPGCGAGDKELLLRNVAHRGGMDYLTEFPQEIGRLMPDSYEAYSQRADVVTSLLDEILRKPPPRPLRS